jgi:hypothetical protein
VEGEETMMKEIVDQYIKVIRDALRTVDGVYIQGAYITSCPTCPMSDTRENPANIRYPIVKCRETAKVCYIRDKIPGWCPYAK